MYILGYIDDTSYSSYLDENQQKMQDSINIAAQLPLLTLYL